MEKIKVLYITGWGRSGSTILGNLLGQLDGFNSVGEIRYIAQRGLVENRYCGCGVKFKECEFWNLFLTKTFDGEKDIYSVAQQRLNQPSAMADRYLPLMFLPGKERILKRRWKEYLKDIENLYRAIASYTHSRVIVDSSKLPLYGYALSLIPNFELYVVHLVRDPRSVAYSWMRKKRQPDKGGNVLVPQHNPLKSSLQWSFVNTTVELLRQKLAPNHYYLLRYEDFVAEPQKIVKEIVHLTQESATSLPFLDKHSIKLDSNHSFSGNPNRFNIGAVELRSDDEWKEKMKKIDKFLVTSQCWPLLLKYHYF